MNGFSLILQVLFEPSSIKFCFKSNSSAPPQDCVEMKQPLEFTKWTIRIKRVVHEPGSSIHRKVPNLKSTSVCRVFIRFFNGSTLLVSHQFLVFRMIGYLLFCTNSRKRQIKFGQNYFSALLIFFSLCASRLSFVSSTL